MIGSLRLRSLAWMPAVTLVFLSCSSSKPLHDPVVEVTEADAGAGASSATGAGTAAVTPTATASATHGGNRGRPEGPPTIETCRSLEKPAGSACHWVLVPTHYCGGAPPRPEMLWPHCSCEACAEAADCPRGAHCATLPTDEECGASKNICLGSRSPCDEKGGCRKDEACMWIAGKATCKVPTRYPPRP